VTGSAYTHPGEQPAPDPRTLAMARLLHIPYSPHQPYLKQARFLLDFDREALYGGAAGGGKSDALLMAALQFVDVPGYAAILFRKSYADLSQPGALMDRAREWFAPHKPLIRWSEIEHKWTFPSGATISFAYIDKVHDHLKYQGAEFQFIGFDELTQFKERQFRYLFSRLRKTEDPDADRATPLSRVPLRMRGATNPGGPGHHWVYLRYVKRWEDWQKARAYFATLTPEARAALEAPAPTAPKPHFHPATIEDNPYLNTDDYDLSLDNLDEITRLQLRKGDWQIKPDGRMFKRSWFEIISEAPSDTRWVRYWDLAATDDDPEIDPDWTAGCLMGRTPQGIIIIKHMVHIRVNEYEVERTVQQTAALDGMSVAIGMEQEPGAAGKKVVSYYRRAILPGYQFHGEPVSGSKTERAKPFAARCGAGDVKLVAGAWVTEYLDELEVFPDGEHDDMVDASSAAYLWLSGRMDTGVGSGGVMPQSLDRSSPYRSDSPGSGLRNDWAA
jgi:predicted phage terminase large subunit-like protein